jgi:adenine/guanine/hypoxanthine permease
VFWRGSHVHNSLAPIAGHLDVAGVLKLSFLPVLLTLFLMSFLDTLGMLVDALTCMFSGWVGTSTSGAYIESATGIREGARTGLASVVTAGLFAVALFFIPLVEPLQHLKFAYAPALVAVGVLMVGSIRKIEFDDVTELVPAFVTVVMMLFTYNIANGLTAGLVVYPVLKVAAGRWRELKPASIVLALLCLVYYVFGLPH